MPTRASVKWARLVAVVETASGELRGHAAALDDLAESLARSQPGRAQELRHMSRRLCAVAEVLTAEAHAEDGKLVRLALLIGTALAASSLAVLSGVGEAAGGVLLEGALGSRDRTAQQLDACMVALDQADEAERAEVPVHQDEPSQTLAREIEGVLSGLDPSTLAEVDKLLPAVIHRGDYDTLTDYLAKLLGILDRKANERRGNADPFTRTLENTRDHARALLESARR